MYWPIDKWFIEKVVGIHNVGVTLETEDDLNGLPDLCGKLEPNQFKTV